MARGCRRSPVPTCWRSSRSTAAIHFRARPPRSRRSCAMSTPSGAQSYVSRVSSLIDMFRRELPALIGLERWSLGRVCPRTLLPKGERMDQIANWLDQHHVSISMIVLTIVVLILASIVLLRVNRLLRGWAHYLETRLHLPYETVATIIRLVIATLWLLTGVIV